MLAAEGNASQRAKAVTVRRHPDQRNSDLMHTKCMKIIFLLTETGFQIRSLCDAEEVAGAVSTIKEQLGNDTEIFALDCPDFTIDLRNGGVDDAANRASKLVGTALDKFATDKNLSRFEYLNPIPAW